MQTVIEKGGIALAGLATSLATAGLVTLVHMWTGFNLFSFSVLVIVPAGAGACGFVAASGYYLAAKFLHQRPTNALFMQMVVIAAFTQALIYWLEYKTASVNGVSVANFISFSQYLDIMMTKIHMRVGRGAGIDTGEVGSFGYWLALFDFIGFLIGGGFVYFLLKSAPSCEGCKKYLRSALKKKDSFTDIEEFAPYYDNVYIHPVDSPEFGAHVGREFSAGKAQKGTINLTTTVFECPQCFGQSVKEDVQIFNGKEWKDISELKRFMEMPRGVDVRPAFR
ncbi:hypothetical protein VVT58_09180 [Sphingobium sp. SJ10-10]|uniref:hypothetical protein n=1 Tax=Sphingobium sp. SJ10-10 TaxID=3114999 RepID=UPI002E19DF50|nr:hypothetical protein [Sphingobium sp. SJ10-10]